MSLTALALSLALGWSSDAAGITARLPPAPLALYAVAWQRTLVPPAEQGTPLEEGGAAVDAASGLVVCGTRDGWLHALRPDGTVVWDLRGHGAFSGAPTIADGIVYAGSSGGRLYAVTLADGKLRWSYDAKEELGTAPVVSGGVVYAMSLQDTLWAIDAASGEWKWLHRREGKGDRGFTIRGAAPVVVRGDTVYGAFSDGYVAAVDAATGQVRWERPVGPSGSYTDIDGLALEGDRLYAAAYAGGVLALDAGSGAQIWSAREALAHRVAARRGLVVAVSATGITGLAPATGQPVWTAPLRGAPGATPVFAGRWLLVPAQEGGLRFVEPSTGRTLQAFDGGAGVTGTPAVRGSRVYVLSDGSRLYALDLR